MEEKRRAFLMRAGLPEEAGEMIGRKFRFFHERDGGYEMGGVIERYEIQGELTIDLFLNQPHRLLRFSAVDPPYGDGVFRWRLIDSARREKRETVGELQLLKGRRP